MLSLYRRLNFILNHRGELYCPMTYSLRVRHFLKIVAKVVKKSFVRKKSPR